MKKEVIIMKSLSDVTRYKNSILDKQEKCRRENKEFILTEQEQRKMHEALGYLEDAFRKKSELKDSLQEKIKEVNKDFETIRDIKTIIETFDKVIEKAVVSNEYNEHNENNHNHNNNDDDEEDNTRW